MLAITEEEIKAVLCFQTERREDDESSIQARVWPPMPLMMDNVHTTAHSRDCPLILGQRAVHRRRLRDVSALVQSTSTSVLKVVRKT